MTRVAVVGGGITGLAAAWHLVSRHLDVHVVVLESTALLGGKLAGLDIAGHRVDGGAESVLARRPEAVELLAELGLSTVHPQRVSASIWSRGRLTPMPAGTLMGVPGDPAALAGLLSEDEVRRARDEQPVPLDGPDIGVGDLVGRAFGPAVVDRLVEPLLGGVYAGHAGELSARACVPALWTAVSEGRRLSEVAAAAARAGAARADDPVFAGLEGGVGTLPAQLATRLGENGVDIRTGAVVSRIDRRAGRGGGWSLRVTSPDARTGTSSVSQTVQADAVLLATPAAPTARLLAEHAPDAAELLRAVEYASMALVTYAFPAEQSERFEDSTGFLVPPIDGRGIKASTFSSTKWPWLRDAAPDLRFVRVSFGRHRETAVLQRPDEALVADGLADLRRALGRVPDPVDARVRRWGGGLPQYALGHVDRVARIRAGVAGLATLGLAGAAYDGVGIPACIASARTAAEDLLTRM